MTGRRTAARCVLAFALFAAACGRSTAPSPGDPPGAETSSSRRAEPVIVRDQREPVAAAGVLEAWRSETGGRYRLESMSSAGEENGDLLIMPSVADAWRLAEADDLRPVYSVAITGDIPAVLHDPESRWVALSTRARVVVYNPALVGSAELASLTGYSSLADDVWKGRLCLSSSDVAGNRLLVAFLLRSLPVRDAEIVVRKWMSNLEGPVYVDDTSLVVAIAAGTCAIGIADSSRVVASASAASVWSMRPSRAFPATLPTPTPPPRCSNGW